MEVSVREIPLFRVLLFFIAGILTADFFHDKIHKVVDLLCLALVFSIVVHYSFRKQFSYRFRYLHGGLLFFNFLIAGMLLYHFRIDSGKKPILPASDLLVAEVLERVKTTAEYEKVKAEIVAVRKQNAMLASHGKVILYLKKRRCCIPEIGDYISFTPRLNEIGSLNNPDMPDFAKMLVYEGIFYQAFLRAEEWKIIQQGPSGKWKKFFLEVRQWATTQLRRISGNEECSAILEAMLLGYKNDLSDEWVRTYSRVGAIHILAVSGLHVGIMYWLISFLLVSFSKRRSTQAIGTVAGIIWLWGYAAITGFSPSVSRAVTMFSVMQLGTLFNRNVHILNSLAASAFLLLIINPAVLFNLGFQFSYLAVIGIVFFYTPLYSMLYFSSGLLDKLWSLSAVSIAAQITTFPLAIYYFHQFPLWFILANWVAIPMSTLLLFGGIVYLLFSWAQWIILPVGWLLDKGVGLLNYILQQIEQLPYATIEELYFSRIEILFLLIAIFFLCWFLLERRFWQIAGFLSMTIFFLWAGTYREWNSARQRKVVIWNTPGFSTINIIDNLYNLLITDIPQSKKKKLEFYTKNHWRNLGLSDKKQLPLSVLVYHQSLTANWVIHHPEIFVHKGFMRIYGHAFFFFSRDTKPFLGRINNVIHAPRVDVFIASSLRKDITEWINLLRPRKIIFTAHVNKKNTKKYLQSFSGEVFYASDGAVTYLIE